MGALAARCGERIINVFNNISCMMRTPAKKSEVAVFRAYMAPYVKEFRRCEKPWRKATEWNDRATLRAQQMGGAAGQTENAKTAERAFQVAEKGMDNLSVEIMRRYHQDAEGLELSSPGEMHRVIKDETYGTEKKIKELGEIVSNEKQRASRKAVLPIVIISLATLAVCAICSIFGIPLAGMLGTIGMGIMAGTGLALGVARLSLDRHYSASEKAVETWVKASARVERIVKKENEGLAGCAVPSPGKYSLN